MRGKKLSRQIAKYLGVETAEEGFAKLLAILRTNKIADLPPQSLMLLENIPVLLDIVDSSYQKYEENLAIAERNLALSSEELMLANRSIGMMVNCLGQGFLMFDESLICAPVYSRACLTLLETTPAGKHIAAVLRLDKDKGEKLASLLRQAFKGSHAMSFEEIMHFAPHKFSHPEGRHIQLDYKAEEDRNGKLEQVVVIATDITDQIRALTLAEERKASFESIERALHDRQSFGSYIRQVWEFVDTLSNEREEPGDGFVLQREAHTLKAGAGAFRLIRLMNALHDCETAIKAFDQSNAPQPLNWATLNRHGQILRQETETVRQHFKNLLGIDVLKLEGESSFDKKAIYDFARYLGSRNLPDLQREFIRRICAESLTAYLKRYDLYANDLAERFNKKVQPIHFTGEDILFVPDRYKALLESFIHIFRNIMDHGIEAPNDRKASGKDEAGYIEISMALRNDNAAKQWLRLEIKDDGAGINVARLRAKLASAAPQIAWNEQGDEEVMQTILTCNISTRDVVTQYSGRGIGMNIVNEEAVKLGGKISVQSQPGNGTMFVVEVPYILDI